MKQTLVLGLVLLSLLTGRLTGAQEVVTTPTEPVFDMNMLITDDEFGDYLSMSATKIQEFLSMQSGVLKDYQETGVDGQIKSAAQIIYDAAQQYKISPKVLLVTIQKESSMLTRSTFATTGYKGSQQYFLDWITFYGWCDSCSSGMNKGFSNQIAATAGAFRRYLDTIAVSGYTVSGWGPNIPKVLDCHDHEISRGLCTAGTSYTVTPINAATAALYTYTPHAGGNKSFWIIWNSYNFGLRRIYPDGALLQVKGKSTIYLIQNGEKRPFISAAAFLSRYNYKQVITVPADHLFVYDTGLSIKYANYSLLQAPNKGIYLLVDDVKRPIISMAAFRNAGFLKEEVIKASWDDLNIYPNGENITTENIYPSGRLLQDKKSGGIYYIKDGLRYKILSRHIFRSQFGKRKPTPTNQAEIDKYPVSGYVGFKDGELVTTKETKIVYFISQGYRLPIASWAAAKAYRFDLIWKNLITTDEASLNVHPIGPTLDVNTANVQLSSR